MEKTAFITRALVKENAVDVIYFDVAKAFDQMPHAKLFEKLSKLSIPYNLLMLIQSFIGKRRYKASVNGEVASEDITSTCGVPEGSNIGPLLFITFCHDLPATIKFAHILQYADDSKLLMEIGSDFDRTKLQIDINNLTEWCDQNGLRINGNETKFVRFYRRIANVAAGDQINYHVNVSIIEYTEKIIDLGILFDNKLTFKPHIASTIAKVNMIIGFITKTSQRNSK